MKVNAISKNCNSIKFGTYNPARAKYFEDKLAKEGIIANTQENDFVAECYNKITNVFKALFGKSALPSQVEFEPLDYGTYGAYYNFSDRIVMNSDKEYSCFFDMDGLKDEMQGYKRFILPEWLSSLHPAHIFAHEFAHSAHWHNLKDKNGYSAASRVWRGLEGTEVPTAIGRLITRFKLSNYSVDSKDMCEFLAERVAKDVCGGITDDTWGKCKKIDVDYSNIFSRRWNYRYSTPQSYLDYFTQQVWNGDIEEANRTGDKVEEYLAEIDAARVNPMIQTAVKIMSFVPNLDTLGELFSSVNRIITDRLDDKNKLKLQ